MGRRHSGRTSSGFRQGEVVRGVGSSLEDSHCNVCATTIIFLSANNTTLVNSRVELIFILTKSRLEKYLLFQNKKNVFVYNWILKNETQILKLDLCFSFYKSWNTQWFLVGSN